MNKLGQLLGNEYEQHKESILTRDFTYKGMSLKVRIPSVAKMESIYNEFKNPNKDAIEVIYKELTDKLIINPEDKVEKTDNDIIIDGRSQRESAKNTYLTRFRILEYFKFLVAQEGQDINTLTYEDINISIPSLTIQMEFVDKINEVILPNYEDIKSK
jgi:hypothetical protein